MIIIDDDKDYLPIYQEIFTLLGDSDAVKKIHEQYGGLMVNFPQKLYSQSYMQKYIRENYGIQSLRAISDHLDISPRRVQQIAQNLGLTKPRGRAVKESST